MQHAIFGTFFVVDDELHCDARAVGPLRIRHLSAIALQISWIGLVSH